MAHRDKRAVAPVATSSLFLPLRRVDLSLFVRSLLSSPVNLGFDKRGGASNSPEFVSEKILLSLDQNDDETLGMLMQIRDSRVRLLPPPLSPLVTIKSRVVAKCQNHKGTLQL